MSAVTSTQQDRNNSRLALNALPLQGIADLTVQFLECAGNRTTKDSSDFHDLTDTVTKNSLKRLNTSTLKAVFLDSR
jgi:hypothetical protein